MTSINKKLWDSVKTTDPSAVKAITGKSYKGNSVNPYWLIERATEVFGAIGFGWGVEVKSERFEKVGEHDVLHVAVVGVWFKNSEGQRSETFYQMGGTKAAYMTSSGRLMVDDDAGKKSVTDGMTKCLSMLGFAGDIFSGLWDDSKYVEWAAKQYEEKPVIIIPASPRTDTLGLSQDELSEITDMSAYIVDLVKEGKASDALDFVLNSKLEEPQRIALNNMLDSKTRSAIKAVSTARKAQS